MARSTNICQAVKNTKGKKLEGGDLSRFLLQMMEYTYYVDKLSRRLFDRRLVELLADGDLQKKDEFKTKAKCEKLAKKLTKEGLPAKLAFDEEHSLYEVSVSPGGGMEARFNWDLASHPEYKRMVEMQARMAEFNKPPFTVASNGTQVEMGSPRELLELLLDQGKKQLAITRFKGLGEISPKEFSQFIGEDIRLIRVAIDKMSEVAQTLEFYMGKNTPERRAYIMEHLL